MPGLSITPLAAFGALRIDVGPHPDWIVAVGDDVWVAGVEPGVAVFRVGTGERVGSVAIEGELCGAPDEAFGSVWFPTCSPSAIARVSIATHEVTARIPLELPPEGEFTIGAGEGGVWAVLEPAGGVGRLARIDPASDRAAEEFEVPLGAWSVRAAHGALWVACPAEDRVVRIDPADGSITADIRTGGGPRFLETSDEGVWVLNQTSGSITHVDPRSRRVVATVDLYDGPMKGGDIAIGLGSVWVRGTGELVTRIDPEWHEVVTRIGQPTMGSASVAAIGGEVWASAGAEGWLFRIPVGPTSPEVGRRREKLDRHRECRTGSGRTSGWRDTIAGFTSDAVEWPPAVCGTGKSLDGGHCTHRRRQPGPSVTLEAASPRAGGGMRAG
jgi:hypothetical protein